MTRQPSFVEAYRAWPFWAAAATAVSVFPLLFVGAGVTSKDAGLAYPDGFTSAGHFLTNPPGWWDSDSTRWEHGHRLLGRAAGILAIALALAAWQSRGAVRTLGVVTLGAIVVQGVMGALRVDQVSTTLAMLHGIWGQVCFCLACVTALRASRWWVSTGPPLELRTGHVLRRVCLLTTAAIFLQLALGAALRHFPSGHALVAHVIWAIVVVFFIGWTSMWVAGHGFGNRLLLRLAQTLGLLAAAQLFLGGFAWLVTMAGTAWSELATWLVPTLHVGVGALVLVNAVLLTAAVFRRVSVAREPISPVGAVLSAL